jgi:iron complex outermembrane receptor protein
VKGIVTCILALSFLAASGQTGQQLTAFAPATSSNETPEFSIHGRVLTTDGQPAPYVSIQVRGTGKVTTTDETGTFAFRNLPEGKYTLLITMSGMQSVERSVEVRKGETASLELRLAIDEKALTEVIVTSGRTLNDRTPSIGKAPIHPMDLPQAVTVLGPQVLREQQVQRLSDAIRNVNGVYLTTTRGAALESFSARGYALGSSNLFKNGTRINNGSMPEMASLERVEVLKGSAAILFGQVAPGGVVNMVTKQPKFKQGGELSFRAGSYDLYKPAFDIYGPLSTKVAYRLNGSFESAGSYRKGVQSQRYYVNPSFLFKLGQKTELVLEGDYLKHDYTPDFGIGTLDGKTIPNVARSAFFGSPWQYNHVQQATAGATIRHRIGENWTLSGGLSYQFYKRDYYGVERVQALANGDWTRPLGRILSEEQYSAGQINLTGKVKTGSFEHTILSGIDADNYKTDAFTFSFPAVAGLPAGSYDKINLLDPAKYVQRTDIPQETRVWRTTAPIDRFGIYVQDLVKLSDKFNVLAGVRASYVVTSGIDSLNVQNDQRRIGQTRVDKAISPRLGLVYKPTSTTSVFASYSNSFVTNTGWDVEGNSVKPSLIDQYEVGIKNELFGGRLSANVTAYRILNNNLAQTAPYLRDGVTANSNTLIKMLSGATISDGVEVDLAASPINGLDLRAGYSYNYMRYTKTDTTAGAFKAGERLVNNPAHTANASAFYTFGFGRVKGLRLGATFLYIGDRNAGWNTDVVKVSGAPFTWRDRLFAVKGYSTLDLSAGYNWKQFSLMAKLSNVTNTLNWYVHENYSVNPIPPTQLMATVSYKF